MDKNGVTSGSSLKNQYNYTINLCFANSWTAYTLTDISIIL